MSPVQQNGKRDNVNLRDNVKIDGLEQSNENRPEFVSVSGAVTRFTGLTDTDKIEYYFTIQPIIMNR